MHGIRAKVNAAGPFHAAEIGIDGDGVENTGVQQFQRWKFLVVVHTERGDSIRIISARRAGKRERKSYEESN
jgi:hypothetical protein